MVWEVEEIRRRKLWMKFSGDRGSITRPEAEGDDRPRIAKHRVDDLGFDLLKILMGRDYADAVLPQLGGHRGEASGREGLEFVEIDEEGAPVGFRNLGAAERGERCGGDQKRAEE